MTGFSGPSAAESRITVLLVEDDEGDAVLVEALLEEVGADFALRRARTLREAVPLAAKVDCVLLDLGLPDTTGLDGLTRLLALDSRAAIIVLTGLDDERQGERAVAAGAEDFLVKGQVDGSALLRGIRYAVGRKHAEETQRQLRDEQLLAAEKTRLERGLLPSPILSRGEGLGLEFRYRPGGSRMLLGGDFFDVVRTPDGTLQAIVGDVCGHGPDEAALGVFLRIAWRALVLADQEPSRVLRTLHEILEHERHQPGLFTTACMVTVSPDRRWARVYLAGHPEPMLLVDDRVVELPRDRAGLPLGVLPDSTWSGLDVPLPPGWSLLMYTDGLVEGRVRGDTERLGSERLIELIKQVARIRPDWPDAPDVLLDDLIARVKDLNGGELDDDMAVLLISDEG
ncbi:PP2C family protein-serine/threonine phosphatase [Saccharothrix obliqua]|uniref:PP2C family protein-serine/threonine phosphatase n=1 Tax=Saccharothrix obliqua TaxID=2861747 RepID=UPI001C5F86E2|nr:SpoIIE family protein phosphatase [Saccharothrix obliqua]MBW4721267.1 SpoIIE family protein phosphatase [Saccharothrix obliqua]